MDPFVDRRSFLHRDVPPPHGANGARRDVVSPAVAPELLILTAAALSGLLANPAHSHISPATLASAAALHARLTLATLRTAPGNGAS